jgi:hypothetical protein
LAAAALTGWRVGAPMWITNLAALAALGPAPVCNPRTPPSR